MSLSDYRRKRTFSQTPEPGGDGPIRKNNTLRFVIQKHHARNLHYDLRLELDGVLKSWAVPKGPSLDPSEKRLAIQVEDHPVEYLDFEGVIPQGQYGAGPVMVWDLGEWTAVGDPYVGYEKGDFKFTLDGHKLQGRWVLVRTRRRTKDANHWLLIKERDANTQVENETNILELHSTSVLTGRSLEEIRAAPDSVGSLPKDPPQTDGSRGVRTETAADSVSRAIVSVKSVHGAKRTKKLPEPEPSLPTSTRSAPEGDGWLHEIKYDGYRMLCYIDGTSIRFVSRNGRDWTDKLISLVSEIKQLSLKSAVLDGEVAMMSEDGTTNFQTLQNHIGAGRDAHIRYYLFDLLYLSGYDVRGATLLDRKTLLHSAVANHANCNRLIVSDHIIDNGPLVFQQACKLGTEGIVSKKINSRYIPGRTTNWLKVKCLQSEEFVVGGYTLPAKSRKGIGALALGSFDEDGGYRYVGRVGTGFTEQSLSRLRGQLEEIATDECPFSDEIALREKDARWVIPDIVVEVEFAGWTNDGLIRFGVYRGTRDDLTPRDINMHSTSDVATRKRAPSVATTVDIDLEGLDQLKLTNPQRIVYPELGVTKLAVATYYAQVANIMLPYVGDRPLSLLRCPKGVGETCFFQKRAPKGLHESVERIDVMTNDGPKETLVVNDVSGLLALVQFGVLEFHVWPVRKDRLDRPDLLVFDLDPDISLKWQKVVAGGIEIRDRLSDLGLQSFVKTTGGKGIHIVVPLRRRNAREEPKKFAELIASRMVADSPGRYTTNSSIKSRPGKIYIDFMRNSRGATFVAPYSTRARANASISVPITWNELETIPNACSITLINAARRLDFTEDPWKDMPDVSQSITRSMLRDVS